MRNVQKWVAALRSGDYAQGTGALRTKEPDGRDKFCVWGVACDISGVGRWASHRGQPAYVDQFGAREHGYIPPSVQRWLGGGDRPDWLHGVHISPVKALHPWDTPLPEDMRLALLAVVEHDGHHSFSQLNDAGVGFELLADLIEWLADQPRASSRTV